jgi:ppGpp synthetase/RelA/SpoT-type nucleotidyltranferase
MVWVRPQYSPEQVDAAGATLIHAAASPEALDMAFTVINNWRSSHAFPLNTFQMTLRRKSREIDQKSLVAQRVKRLSAIDEKLRRLDWLRLSEMQDIGGCRAVVRTVRGVNRLVKLYKDSDLKHDLDDEDDYIERPSGQATEGSISSTATTATRTKRTTG